MGEHGGHVVAEGTAEEVNDGRAADMEKPTGWRTATTAELVARGRALADALDEAVRAGDSRVPDPEWDEFMRKQVSELLDYAERSESVQRQLNALSPEQLEQLPARAATLLAAYLRRRHSYRTKG